MTSANVTQAASMFLGAVSAGAQAVMGNKESAFGEGFSQVMSQTAGAEKNQNLAPKAEDRPVSTKTRVESDGRNAVKDTSGKVSSQKSDEKPSDGGKIDEAVKEAVEEVKEAIAEELGISVEDLEKAMEMLGLTGIDLLNPDNIQGLVMELSGETDFLSLLTNGELYDTVQNLTGVVEEVNTQLMEALGIDGEKLQGLLEEASQNAQKTETIPDFQQTDEAGEKELLGEEAAGNLEKAKGAKADAPVVEVSKEAETADDSDKTMETQEKDLNPLKGQQAQPDGAEQTVENEKTLETVQAKHDSGQGKGQGEGSQENGSSFLQDFTRQGINTPDANIAQAREAVPFESFQTQRIMEQITEYMKVQIKPDVTELTMQLQPESLGTLNIHLTAREGIITAQLTTQNEAVKAALETQIVQLRETLSEQGLKVDTVEVTVASHDFNRSLRQGSGENNESSYDRNPKKRGIRKINLEEGVSLEELELDEEERIAAEIMEQNGNTVDYTA